MATQSDSEWAYVRFPEQAWDILSEALAMDIESGDRSLELRDELEEAFEATEHLFLVSLEEVVLRPGDEFDIVPDDGGVIIKKRKGNI